MRREQIDKIQLEHTSQSVVVVKPALHSVTISNTCFASVRDDTKSMTALHDHCLKLIISLTLCSILVPFSKGGNVVVTTLSFPGKVLPLLIC